MLTCSGVTWENRRSVAFVSVEKGSERSAAIAVLFRYTILPSPFFVCGIRMRECSRSRSSQRSPRISERRIPVVTAKPRIGRSHSGLASNAARNSVGASSERGQRGRGDS